MHPYRTPATRDPCEDRGPDPASEATVLWVLFAGGAVPVAAAAARGGTYGAVPTMGMLLVLFAARQLASHYSPTSRARRRGRAFWGD